jgi:hypothetical protein
MENFASFRVRRIHFASELRRRIQNYSSCAKKGHDLFGQGIVLADTKTAAPSLRAFVPSLAVTGALNAYGLFARLARVPRENAPIRETQPFQRLTFWRVR